MPGSIGGRSAKSASFSEGASSRRQATKSLGGEATTADNAERARRGGPKKKLDAARLNALADEFEAFFGELQSDVYAEYTEGEGKTGAANKAHDAYKEAMAVASTDLVVTHPIRLGLALNFSVFHYEVLGNPEENVQKKKIRDKKRNH